MYTCKSQHSGGSGKRIKLIWRSNLDYIMRTWRKRMRERDRLADWGYNSVQRV